MSLVEPATDVPQRPSSPGESDIQTDVLLRGFLTKRGAVVKNWQLRYFVLEYGRLSYYTDARCRARNLKGRIALAEVSEVAPVPPDSAWGKTNAFRLVTPQRTFYMFSQNVSDRDLWISLIRSQCPNASHQARLSKTPPEPIAAESSSSGDHLASSAATVSSDSVIAAGERESNDAEAAMPPSDTAFGWLEAQTQSDAGLGLPAANFPDVFLPPDAALASSSSTSTCHVASLYYSTIDALFAKLATPVANDLRPLHYHPGPLLDQLAGLARQFSELSLATASRLVTAGDDGDWRLYEAGVLYTVVTRVPGLDADLAAKLVGYEMKNRRFVAPELLSLGLHLPLMVAYNIAGHTVTAVALPPIVDRCDWRTSPLLLPRLDRVRHRLRLSHLGTVQLVRGCDGRHYVLRTYGLFPLKPPTERNTASEGDPVPVARFAHPNSVVHLAAGDAYRNDNTVINAAFRRCTSSSLDALSFASAQQFRAWLSTSAISLHMLGELVYLASDRSSSSDSSLRVTLESLPTFPAPSPPSSPQHDSSPSSRQQHATASSLPPAPAPTGATFAGFRLADLGIRVSPLPSATPFVVLGAKPALPVSWLRYAVEEMCVRAVRRAVIRRFRAGSPDAARHLLGQLFLCQDDKLALLGSLVNSTFFLPFGLQFAFANDSFVSLAAVFRRLLKVLPVVVADTRQPLRRQLAEHAGSEFPALQLDVWPRCDSDSDAPAVDVVRGLLLGDWGHSSPHTHAYRGLLAVSVGNHEHGLESLALASALFGGPFDEPAIVQFGRSLASKQPPASFGCFSAWDFLDAVDSLICLAQSYNLSGLLDWLKAVQQVTRTLKMDGIFLRTVALCTLYSSDGAGAPAYAAFELTGVSLWSKDEQQRLQLLRRLAYGQIERVEPLDGGRVRIRTSSQRDDLVVSSPVDNALWTQLGQHEELVVGRFAALSSPVARQLSGLLRQIHVLRDSMQASLAEHPGLVEQMDGYTLPHKVVGYDSISQARLKLHLYRSASLPTNLVGVESALVVESQQLLVWLKTCYDNLAARVALHSFATSISATPGVFFDVFPRQAAAAAAAASAADQPLY